MAHQAAHDGLQLTAADVDALPDAVFASDVTGHIVAWNDAAVGLLGWAHDQVLGAACADMLEGIGQGGQHVCSTPCPLLATALPPMSSSADSGLCCTGRAGWAPTLDSQRPQSAVMPHPNMLVRRSDGTRTALVTVAVPAALDGTRVLLHLLRAVPGSERDALTGTLSRDGFLLRVLDEQHRALRSGDPTALALIDLDHLKHINDRHGHVAGDRVLSEVAAHLRAGRREDVVGRWGGDEFVMLLPRSGRLEAARRLRRTLAIVRRLVAVGPTPVTFSAGIVDLRPRDSLAAALDHADTALYRAKAAGRGRVRTARTKAR